VIGAMVYFAIAYRRRKGRKYSLETDIGKSNTREAVIFASISIIILVGLTVASYTLTPNARFMPSSSSNFLAIDVTAFQWGFRFDYPGNVSVIDQVNVPDNSTVMFNVTSTDVMHNFYLVQYKVSIDAIPGKYNVIYVTTPVVNNNGTINYDILCKELCGSGHTYMNATMTVMNVTVFNQWLANQTSTPSSSGG